VGVLDVAKCPEGQKAIASTNGLEKLIDVIELAAPWPGRRSERPAVHLRKEPFGPCSNCPGRWLFLPFIKCVRARRNAQGVRPSRLWTSSEAMLRHASQPKCCLNE